jgi:hypothetical protein
VCDLETSRIGAPYIYDISNLRVKIQIVQSNPPSPVTLEQQEFILILTSLTLAHKHQQKFLYYKLHALVNHVLMLCV